MPGIVHGNDSTVGLSVAGDPKDDTLRGGAAGARANAAGEGQAACSGLAVKGFA